MRPATLIIILAIIATGGLSACGHEALSIPLDLAPETPALTFPADQTLPTSSPSIDNTRPPAPTYSPGPSPTPPPDGTNTPDPPPPQVTPTVEPEQAPSPVFRVVGYITHWRFYRLSQMDLEGLTHLIWQGVEVTSAVDPSLRVSGNGDWGQIPALVEAGRAGGARVLVSLIGFWNDNALTSIWKSAGLRKTLIENLVDLVESYDLDGIDIDNENWCDKALYSTFVSELHDALSPLGKIITMAGSPYEVRISPEVFDDIEFVNIMTYDMGRGKGYPYHSTLEESAQALNYWVDEGISSDKVLMGIPFHGRDSYNGYYEYWWIVDQYKPATDQNQVSEPAAAGNAIWWNSPELVEQKTLYAVDNGFGGVMMYELGTDSLSERSLLGSVYKALELSDSGARENP